MTGRWIPFAAAIVIIGRASLTRAQSPTPPRGETAMITIPSKIYPAGRRAWAYTPTGYPDSCHAACNLIVAFDGGMYLGAMPLPQILDSLIAANRAAPSVAEGTSAPTHRGVLFSYSNVTRFGGSNQL